MRTSFTSEFAILNSLFFAVLAQPSAGCIPSRVAIPTLGGMAKRSAAMIKGDLENMPAPAAWACHPERDAPLSADPVLEAESQRIAVIDRIAPSVVAVFDSAQRGGGSGVLIDPAGFGLTNYHVVAGMLDTRRGLGGLSDGKLYELEVLGIDPTGDVAMFRLIGREEFPFAVLGDSDAVRVGDTAVVMGNPFSLSDDYTPSVTLGIVTGTHRYQWGTKSNLVYSDCLQVDASVNPGNSGGPLFNASGKVIGINGRISLKPPEPLNPRGRFNVGVGYAITANQIIRFMPALRAGLLARHGTLQATVEQGAGDGIVFAEMLRRGSAYKAGVRLGDRILAFDGKTITSPNHLASLIGTYPADWDVPITIEREGRQVEFVARLDPIEPKLTTPFTVDREVNLREVRRVLRAHQGAMLTHPSASAPRQCTWTVIRTYDATAGGPAPEPERYRVSYEQGGPIRMQPQDTSKLPPGARVILGAVCNLHWRMLTPVEKRDLTGVHHSGANRLLRGPRLVEVIHWPIGDAASADFWFDAATRDALRIEIRYISTRTDVTIDLLDYRDVGGLRRACTFYVRGLDYAYRDTLTDWEVVW